MKLITTGLGLLLIGVFTIIVSTIVVLDILGFATALLGLSLIVYGLIKKLLGMKTR